jgi:hypothetical protein
MTVVHSPCAWHRLTDPKFPGTSTSGLRTFSSAAAVLLCCLFAIPARAQPLLPGEDPDTERRFGLWLDQTVAAGLAPNRWLEFEFHERFDEGGTNLFEYFLQGGPAFRLRPWLTVIPIFRYQRYPGDAMTPYEIRLLLNVTVSTKRGRWQPILRTLTEGRFPKNRIASARFRIRPGFEYTLPLPMRRPPVAVVNHEFFVVPGANSFNAGGKFTQNRFQAGVRFPITESFAIRPYYMRVSVNRPTGWEGSNVIGFSIGVRVRGLEW